LLFFFAVLLPFVVNKDYQCDPVELSLVYLLTYFLQAINRLGQTVVKYL